MYIGTQEIDNQKGNEVFFKDNTSNVFTEKQLEYIITEEEKTPSDFQNLCANEIVKDLLQVLDDHNIKQGDLQFIISKLIYSYNSTFDDLVAEIFTKRKGSDLSEITVLDIKRTKQDFNI